MNPIFLVIEIYGGIVQNVYVAHESPDALLHAVVVDWDYEYYKAPDDCVVHATGLDGNPTLACVSMAKAEILAPLANGRNPGRLGSGRKGGARHANRRGASAQ